MNRLTFAAFGALGLASATPALAARTVDYAVDDATLAAWATEQGLAAPAPLPAKGASAITVTMAPGVDHEAMRVGILCSAWKVENPITKIIGTAFAAASNPAGPNVAVTIDRAGTLTRCIVTGELKGMCLTRVTIAATVTAPGAAPKTVEAKVERAAKSVGACAGLTRGIALISREATIALVGEVGKAVAAAKQ